MIYGIYAIKDEKVGFLQIMQDSNDFTAIRNFNFAMSRPDSLYQANKGDFKLYKLACFDSITGELDLLPSMQMIADGSALLEV